MSILVRRLSLRSVVIRLKQSPIDNSDANTHGVISRLSGKKWNNQHNPRSTGKCNHLQYYGNSSCELSEGLLLHTLSVVGVSKIEKEKWNNRRKEFGAAYVVVERTANGVL